MCSSFLHNPKIPLHRTQNTSKCLFYHKFQTDQHKKPKLTIQSTTQLKSTTANGLSDITHTFSLNKKLQLKKIDQHVFNETTNDDGRRKEIKEKTFLVENYPLCRHFLKQSLIPSNIVSDKSYHLL